MKKVWIIISIILIILISLVIYNKFKMPSSVEITYMTAYFPPYKEKDSMETKSFEITDENIIKNIIDIYKNNSAIGDGENKYQGQCCIWIDLKNGTIIGLYMDTDYGYIGNKIERVGNQRYLPQGLNNYIVQIINEQLKEEYWLYERVEKCIVFYVVNLTRL